MTVEEFTRELEERGIFGQTAIAYRLGYSQATISRYLNGKREIPARIRTILAGIRRKRQHVGDESETVGTSKD